MQDIIDEWNRRHPEAIARRANTNNKQIVKIKLSEANLDSYYSLTLTINNSFNFRFCSENCPEARRERLERALVGFATELNLLRAENIWGITNPSKHGLPDACKKGYPTLMRELNNVNDIQTCVNEMGRFIRLTYSRICDALEILPNDRILGNI